MLTVNIKRASPRLERLIQKLLGGERREYIVTKTYHPLKQERVTESVRASMKAAFSLKIRGEKEHNEI